MVLGLSLCSQNFSSQGLGPFRLSLNVGCHSVNERVSLGLKISVESLDLW